MITELINASNIMFENEQVKNVYLGRTSLWEQNPQSKTFTLQPIVLDSDANLVLTYKNSLPTQGNSTFLIKTPGVDISKIDISYPYESINSNVIPRVIFQKIDNYALYCNRYGTFNSWPGGTTTGLFEENVTFTYKDQLGSQSKEINFYGRGDENNQMFLEGLYVNKVIKVPSKGKTDSVNIKFYPYTFDDEFYSMQTCKIWLVDYEDTSNNRQNLYLWDNDNHVFRHTTNDNVKTLNDTIFSSFEVSYYGLTGTINYTIKPNESGVFKDAALSIRDCMVHFVQEPHDAHRIYIVNWHTRAFNFANGDSYLCNGDTSENMFHLSGSVVIDNNIEFNFTKWVDVLIPESLEEEYNIEFVGNTKSNNGTYEWDDISFKFYTCYTNSKIIFNKK